MGSGDVLGPAAAYYNATAEGSLLERSGKWLEQQQRQVHLARELFHLERSCVYRPPSTRKPLPSLCIYSKLITLDRERLHNVHGNDILLYI